MCHPAIHSMITYNVWHRVDTLWDTHAVGKVSHAGLATDHTTARTVLLLEGRLPRSCLMRQVLQRCIRGGHSRMCRLAALSTSLSNVWPLARSCPVMHAERFRLSLVLAHKTGLTSAFGITQRERKRRNWLLIRSLPTVFASPCHQRCQNLCQLQVLIFQERCQPQNLTPNTLRAQLF